MMQKLFFVLTFILSFSLTEMAHARHRHHRYRGYAPQTQEMVQPNFFGESTGMYEYNQQPQPERLTRAQRRALARQQQAGFGFAGPQAYANPSYENAYSNSWNNGFSGGGGAGGVRPGERCHAGDRDPIKCKVCAIYGEDNRSSEGMRAVAGVIETRLQTGHWGSDACSVVHARGQFVGAWRTLPRDPQRLQMMVDHARSAGANGYLGFRSYGGHNCRWIGGNCYRHTTQLEPGREPEPTTVVLDPKMTAEDVDSQAAQNLEHMAEIQSDIGAG